MKTRNTFNSEKPFGVEFEFVMPQGQTRETLARAIGDAFTLSDGMEHANIRCGNWSRTGGWSGDSWYMKTDGTVTANSGQRSRGMTGANELVTPKLYGEDGFRQIEIVLQVMNDLGCEVNKSCGLHVHHDLTGIKDFAEAISPATNRKAWKTITNLIMLVGKWEEWLYKLVPVSRRPGGNCHSWSRSINQNYDSRLSFSNGVPTNRINVQYRMAKVKRGLSNGSRASFQYERTCGLNFRKFWLQGSVEFRYQGGTLSNSKVKNWVVFTQAFVNKASEMKSINYLYDRTDGLSANGAYNWMKRSLGIMGHTANNPAETYDETLVADCSKWINKRYATLNGRI